MRQLNAILILAIISTSILSCTGDDGPAGLNGASLDTENPTVVLEYPTASTTIRESFTAVASAVDNTEIEKVSFYLDGSNRINDTTYSDVFEAPFSYLYDFDKFYLEDGLHTFQARAFDLQGNISNTLPIIFYIDHLPHTGSGVLRHWTADSLNTKIIPGRNSNNSSIITDSLYSLRFDIERTCIIDSVRIYLDSIPDVEMNYDRDIFVDIYNSNGIYPTSKHESIIRKTISSTNLSGTGFHKAIFAPSDTLKADKRYHVVFGSTAPSDTTLMAVKTSVRETYPFPTDNYSGLAEIQTSGDAVWKSLQEQNPGDMAREYLLELWVHYLD